MVATRKRDDVFKYQLVTGSEVASAAGDYFWEVQMLNFRSVLVGVVPPSLDHEEDHQYNAHAYLSTWDKTNSKVGDRVGVRLKIAQHPSTGSNSAHNGSMASKAACKYAYKLAFYLNGSIRGSCVRWTRASAEPLAFAGQWCMGYGVWGGNCRSVVYGIWRMGWQL